MSFFSFFFFFFSFFVEIATRFIRALVVRSDACVLRAKLLGSSILLDENKSHRVEQVDRRRYPRLRSSWKLIFEPSMCVKFEIF